MKRKVETSGGLDLASWTRGQLEKSNHLLNWRAPSPIYYLLNMKRDVPHCTRHFCIIRGLHHVHPIGLLFLLRGFSSAAAAVATWIEFIWQGKDW